MEPINRDAFDAELAERRRTMQQDPGGHQARAPLVALMAALLVALAAVIAAASLDGRDARAHTDATADGLAVVCAQASAHAET